MVLYKVEKISLVCKPNAVVVTRANIGTLAMYSAVMKQLWFRCGVVKEMRTY